MEIHGKVIKLTALLLAFVASFATTTAYTNDDLQQKMNDPANWANWGGNYQGTRYSELDQINTENVHQLQVAWMEPTGVMYGHEGGPLVVDNTIYIHTPYPNKVFAFNQEDHSLIWLYEGNSSPVIIFGKDNKISPHKTINNGLAYGNGMIFLHQADTTLVAIDAETGKKVWSAQNGNPRTGSRINSAPIVVKDKVLVGHYRGRKFGGAGFITAYNISDGSRAWRGYSMGPDNEMLMDPEKSFT